MDRVGVLNLGLGEERLNEYLLALRGVMTGDNWDDNIPTFDYNKIDPTQIANSCKVLVLSPGDDAKVGLLDYKRAIKDPQMGPLSSLVQAAIIEGDVPILGVNGGYEALMGSLGCAIKELSDDEKLAYHRKRVHDLSQGNDSIIEGIDQVSMTLSNNYGVMLLGPPDQKRRWGQSVIKHIVTLDDFALMSRVETRSGAPIIGVQFNIEDGTKEIFGKYFKSVAQYLETK